MRSASIDDHPALRNSRLEARPSPLASAPDPVDDEADPVDDEDGEPSDVLCLSVVFACLEGRCGCVFGGGAVLFLFVLFRTLGRLPVGTANRPPFVCSSTDVARVRCFDIQPAHAGRRPQ